MIVLITRDYNKFGWYNLGSCIIIGDPISCIANDHEINIPLSHFVPLHHKMTGWHLNLEVPLTSETTPPTPHLSLYGGGWNLRYSNATKTMLSHADAAAHEAIMVVDNLPYPCRQELLCQGLTSPNRARPALCQAVLAASRDSRGAVNERRTAGTVQLADPAGRFSVCQAPLWCTWIGTELSAGAGCCMPHPWQVAHDSPSVALAQPLFPQKVENGRALPMDGYRLPGCAWNPKWNTNNLLLFPIWTWGTPSSKQWKVNSNVKLIFRLSVFVCSIMFHTDHVFRAGIDHTPRRLLMRPRRDFFHMFHHVSSTTTFNPQVVFEYSQKTPRNGMNCNTYIILYVYNRL